MVDYTDLRSTTGTKQLIREHRTDQSFHWGINLNPRPNHTYVRPKRLAYCDRKL